MDYENIVEETKVVEEVVTKATPKSWKGFAIATTVGLAGAALVKFVVVPVCKKLQAKKEQAVIDTAEEKNGDDESK